MRKMFFILLIAVTAIANAQTIHWLTFIDTTDRTVGDIDKNGRKVLYGHFIDVVNAALAEKGYKSDIQDYYDTRLSPQNCKSAIEHLSCAPNDIVVFYYIGHGTHAAKENNVYPQMLLGCDWSEESKFIPLTWVHQQLKAKNVRLAVTVGMCCNVIQSATAKTAPTFSVNYGNVYLTETEKNAIQKMFLQNTGDILISSASMGQSSGGGKTCFGDMDFFTAVLVSCFEESASEGNLDWNTLFNEVRGYIHNATGGQQTPMWTPNISSASMPAKQTATAPQQAPKPKTSQSSAQVSDENINILSNAFDHLIDNGLSESERIAYAQKVESVFSSNAIVRTMSQDGDIVVDKSSAEDFIGRLATSRILLKVIPISYTMSGNVITELKVKEFYRK